MTLCAVRAALTAVALLAAAPAAQCGEAAAAPMRTLLDEVFPDGLPFPFERVLERLRDEAGPDAVRTALIPLGRSLQRYSAAPEYFASPRIVVAVSADRARGPDMPRLADRLYIGYAPAADVIEAISYDESSGRFEFQEIVGYGRYDSWPAEAAERSICLRCHQGGGPIFSRPLWNETNAHPAVSARLSELGQSFHGAPVRQSVDELDAFDAATDRAARIEIANRLWAEGCPDAACRAELLAAALRLALNGFQANWQGGETAATAVFDANASTLWPDGLSIVSPDLPNREPLTDLGTADPETALETTGALDPETPRERVILWHPGEGAFYAAAREIATMFSTGDFEWLDEQLRGVKATGRARSLRCDMASVPTAGEVRFACGGGGDRVQGFLRPDGSGRIDRLEVGGAAAPSRIAVRVSRGGGAHRLEATGIAPRLPDGSRIAELELSGETLRFEIVEDYAQMAAALEQHARDGGVSFAPGPVRRRELLMLIADLLGAANG